MTLAKPLDVLLLRDVPQERRLSMERFADELELIFDESVNVRLRSSTMHAKSGVFRTADRYLTRFIRYPLAVRRAHADVFHIVDQGYADLAAVLPCERTVVTCHDVMLLRAEFGDVGFRGHRTSLWRFRWSTSYLRRVARVICVSEATRNDVIRLVGVDPSRIEVVPQGVNQRFRPSLTPPISRGTSIILHVSTGVPYKNTSTTLRVISELRSRGLNVTLLRVGTTLAEADLQLARELAISDWVDERGYVSDDELVRLYNEADLLLFPSHYEGFGWPPLEAMACGTPVVASSASAIASVVGAAGLLAQATDVHTLADHAEAILTRPDLAAKLRERGLAQAATFSWTRVAEAYESIWTDVAQDNR